MKPHNEKNQIKTLLLKTLGILCFAIIAFTIHSCRKDTPTSIEVSDPEILNAKNWYENTYPQGSSVVTLSPVTTLGNGARGHKDLNQLIKPDWGHNDTYYKFNKKVIEMPIDPSDKYSFSVKNQVKNYNKAYTRTSFLIFKDSIKYQAYIMMIVADSAYINGDFTKLSRNTYRKHDADFSGIVLYFAPKGKFIRSFGYKNGQIIPVGGNGASTTPTTQGIKTLSNQTPFTPVCQDWYWVTYDQYGEIFDIQFAFTICEDGNSGGGTSTSDPCVISNNIANQPVVNGTHDPIGEGPGGGGDFPDPGNNPCEGCPINVIEIQLNSTDNPNVSITSIQSADQATRTVNLPWTFLKIKNESWSYMSVETGVKHYDGTDWKWVSLVHSGITMVGLARDSRYQMNVLATAANVADYVASMQITYNIKSTLLCSDGKSQTYATAIFMPTHTWSSN